MTSAIDRLVELGVVTPAELRGCPPRSLGRLERTLGVALPADYRAFLRAVGSGAGRFLADLHVEAFYPEVIRLNRLLADRLPDVTVPAGRFCFATHLGEDWLFLDGGGSHPDPPVWCVTEQSYPKFRRGYARFGVWLADMVGRYDEA